MSSAGKSALTKHNLAVAYNAGDMIIHGTANDSKASAFQTFFAGPNICCIFLFFLNLFFLFAAVMIIISATGDQTQIVLRSADMSSALTCIFCQDKNIESLVSKVEQIIEKINEF